MNRFSTVYSLKNDLNKILIINAGFCGKNIATTARLKTSRRVVACGIFLQKFMVIKMDLGRNCQHKNADTNNFDEIYFAEFILHHF